ncbi:DUF2938 family protein [Flavobacterium psychrotolerans]|uniref:DUF2938 domain-containing protein n=1 Tax=Flavobacterium psychrotolerans TaxID=2169410 RepID=A0A2U1JHS4_9FLAO|nr:DUF2938 family protein [Flavobacterium psychrotolerans]PWA04478.1 DUF2938 domain-containing protein [Flavobacterium psychrotolerans]
MKIVKTILIGTGATIAIDCFTFMVSLFGKTPRDILFVGRWLACMPKGKFLHHTIIETPSIANELIVGRIAHYCIGITFAFLLIIIMYGEKWLLKPTLCPALIVAIITLITPIFILQPALGFGIGFFNMPQQVQLISKTILIHAIYGFGLYLSAILLI